MHEYLSYSDDYLKKLSENLEEGETLYLCDAGASIFNKDFGDCTVEVLFPAIGNIVYIKGKMDPVETYIMVLRRAAEAAYETREENQKFVRLDLWTISR